MGIKMIDFGSIELKEKGAGKALKASDKDGWLAEVQSFKFSKAKTGTLQIEITFKVTDEKAEDIEGTSFTGKRVWDRMFFTEKSAKMTKMKLRGLGYPVNDLVVEGEDDIQDLAEELNDSYVEAKVRLVTEVQDSGYRKDNDGKPVKETRVSFINEG